MKKEKTTKIKMFETLKNGEGRVLSREYESIEDIEIFTHMYNPDQEVVLSFMEVYE